MSYSGSLMASNSVWNILGTTRACFAADRFRIMPPMVNPHESNQSFSFAAMFMAAFICCCASARACHSASSVSACLFRLDDDCGTGGDCRAGSNDLATVLGIMGWLATEAGVSGTQGRGECIGLSGSAAVGTASGSAAVFAAAGSAAVVAGVAGSGPGVQEAPASWFDCRKKKNNTKDVSMMCTTQAWQPY